MSPIMLFGSVYWLILCVGLPIPCSQHGLSRLGTLSYFGVVLPLFTVFYLYLSLFISYRFCQIYGYFHSPCG